MAAFSHLLSPGRIGSLWLKNRMYMTAMGDNLADPGGFVGERTRAFYTARAKGGAALLTVGSVSVGYPIGSNLERQVALSDDKYIPGIASLAEIAHKHQAKLALQLHFGGLVAMTDMKEGRSIWTPSLPGAPEGGSDVIDGFLPDELAGADFAKVPQLHFKVMTAQDIEHLVQMFAEAAARGVKAGADGVEIHGGHGYILSSFLSPHTNHRTDEYGGPVENRARILVDVIKGIRDAVGRDYPVWVKLDSQEFEQREGISIDDAIKAARIAEAAGADAITVSAFHDHSKGVLHSNSNIPDPKELLVPGAAAIKQAVSIPVLTSGRIEPEAADKHIGQGKFDFFGMGRKLLADPDLPRKIAEGRPEEIRPCIYCYNCVSQIYFSQNVRCTVNPEAGLERELAIEPTPSRKKIVVVGGGPGGMEAARRLWLKGHEVTLIEKGDRLGGTARFASIAYEPNEGILKWLKREIGETKVEVRLNTEATPDLLRSLAPDAVVVATGAVRNMPAIPGAQRSNVFSGDDMRRLVLGENLDSLKGKTGWTTRLAMKAGQLTGATRNLDVVREASKAWLPFGDRIVIIGGELVGLELAEFLAKRGRRVTVVDEAPKFGAGIYIVRRWRVLSELHELGVTLLPGARDITIGDNEVTYRTAHDQIRSLGADHVIVAKGATGDLSLADRLKATGFNVYTAGDCNGVGYIDGAMRAAAEVASVI